MCCKKNVSAPPSPVAYYACCGMFLFYSLEIRLWFGVHPVSACFILNFLDIVFCVRFSFNVDWQFRWPFSCDASVRLSRFHNWQKCWAWYLSMADCTSLYDVNDISNSKCSVRSTAKLLILMALTGCCWSRSAILRQQQVQQQPTSNSFKFTPTLKQEAGRDAKLTSHGWTWLSYANQSNFRVKTHDDQLRSHGWTWLVGPALRPLVGSRGKAPGGGPGGEAPGSSRFLGNLYSYNKWFLQETFDKIVFKMHQKSFKISITWVKLQQKFKFYLPVS